MPTLGDGENDFKNKKQRVINVMKEYKGVFERGSVGRWETALEGGFPVSHQLNSEASAGISTVNLTDNGEETINKPLSLEFKTEYHSVETIVQKSDIPFGFQATKALNATFRLNIGHTKQAFGWAVVYDIVKKRNERRHVA